MIIDMDLAVPVHDTTQPDCKGHVNRQAEIPKMMGFPSDQFLCYISILHPKHQTHGPSVLDLGTEILLEVVAWSVSAVDTKFIPSEAAH